MNDGSTARCAGRPDICAGNLQFSCKAQIRCISRRNDTVDARNVARTA
jgi:hypothetical protein